jgi:hypothetical protein
MYFIDYPHQVPLEEYEDAIHHMVKRLTGWEGVLSIFQIGSIRNPGISDIDMLVVFQNGVECKLNPLKELSKSARYLFSHSLYGVSETHFHEAQQYTFFHHYRFLKGEELPLYDSNLSEEEIQTLKTQTALEYLVKMYINTTVERTYGIIKLRALFLQAKALLYDLELLNIESGTLFDLIQTIIFLRDKWFEHKSDKRILSQWHDNFYEEFSYFLKTLLQTKKLYVPERNPLSVARNMTFVPSNRLSYTHGGITLPSLLSSLGRKYFNLQHRFSKFYFHIPLDSSKMPCILEKRFEFISKMKAYNSVRLPHFLSLATSLHIV